MIKRSLKIHLLLLFVLFPSVFSFSFSLQNSETKGNKFYHEGKYEDAVKAYTEGLAKKANYSLYYNRGASFFKLGQYDKALSDFENSATYSNSEEGHIKAIYNAGNSSFMKAEADKTKNPSTALESYEKSVKHFERVLQLDKNNPEAAYNLELGRVRIDEIKKQQQDKDQQQKNQKNGNQDNQNQQSQNQQQQDQQKNNQDNQDQQAQGQQNNNPDNQNQQSQDQQQQGQQSEEDNPQKLSASEAVSPEDILKEEARRKEAVNLQLSNGSAVPVDKDW